ncbi:MAG: endopeptidase La [Acidobacteria bacterium]|nr:endopeptidase La [Acidobacteriota bacterium]
MARPAKEATVTAPETTIPAELPLLPVRDTVLFPNAVLPLTIGRESSIALVQSLGENRFLGVITQKDPHVDVPGPNDLHPVGSVAVIHKVIRMPNQSLFIFCEGISRMRVVEYTDQEPFLRARIEPIEDAEPEMTAELEALRQNAIGLFQQIVALSPSLSDDLQSIAANIKELGKLADFMAGSLPSLSSTEKQEVLGELDVQKRLSLIHLKLTKELEVQQLRTKIQSEVQDQLSQTQREFYLREQMKAIQKELGEGDEQQREIEELKEKIEQAGLPEEAKKEAMRELKRLSRMSPAAADYTVTRTYLDWLVILPWNKSTGIEVDVRKAKAILDEDHYDLEKVKDRILDYLAVKQLNPTLKGPILCFVGPPGVGKTSLGKSIARALGRKFVRISLGGVHDEAEIRGHRRTYIGALPGQIIQGIRRAETNDPVFMLDEIDKVGRDFRGDPASALLEALDPEQNNTFRDNYLDLQFDLSRVLFITTANVLDPVPDALRDRMQVLELQGYTELEKQRIAFSYLIPRQTSENGIRLGENIVFSEEGVSHIIRLYTREAGVRNLEREIGTICRKQARRIAEGTQAPGACLTVTPEVVKEMLGPPKFRIEDQLVERTKHPGVAVGLAWTPTGGDVLFVEAGTLRGGGKGLIMTGHLGQVMQESMQAALSWVRANAAWLHLHPDFMKTNDVHLHVPAGAIPKDGPSAGVTMVTALVSRLTGRRVRPQLAMTGEITLTGQVLPVGGIKEKVLAAKAAGVAEVILPAENEVNVQEDLKSEQLGDMKLHYVRTIEEVIDYALVARKQKPKAKNQKVKVIPRAALAARPRTAG